MADIDPKTVQELEAAVFQRLIKHLRANPEVQNIDMMNLAGFCRNCLSNWYMDAAQEKGIELSKDDSREIVYGMTYAEWKEKHQTDASADKLKRFDEVRPQESRD